MTNPTIIAELKRVAAEHGGYLRPKDVVKAAREETSPLHSQFTWDNNLAAEKYRLHQARQLISVVVEYTGPEMNQMSRVFVSLTENRREAEGYIETAVAMSDPRRRERLLKGCALRAACVSKKVC